MCCPGVDRRPLPVCSTPGWDLHGPLPCFNRGHQGQWDWFEYQGRLPRTEEYRGFNRQHSALSSGLDIIPLLWHPVPPAGRRHCTTRMCGPTFWHMPVDQGLSTIQVQESEVLGHGFNPIWLDHVQRLLFLTPGSACHQIDITHALPIYIYRPMEFSN